MIIKIKKFYKLARLDKPIGIYLLLWPSLIGLLLGGFHAGSIDIINYFIVIIGSILVRSCGCVINDISDYKFDKYVKRTAERPLSTGELTLKEAWAFFVILSCLSLALLLTTSILTIKIALFYSLLIVIYPLTKRFFMAPQFILGITFGSGAIISYSLQADVFSLSLLILYIALIIWVISFDTLYAMEDLEDDKKIGIYSTPILWGDNTILISRSLHCIFYVLLGIIAIVNNFSMYFVFIMLILIYFHYEQVRLIDKKKYLDAFKYNSKIGFIAFVGFAIEILIL
jgi:4-hydroxybenzoate polyprenyltransferase